MEKCFPRVSHQGSQRPPHLWKVASAENNMAAVSTLALRVCKTLQLQSYGNLYTFHRVTEASRVRFTREATVCSCKIIPQAQWESPRMLEMQGLRNFCQG